MLLTSIPYFKLGFGERIKEKTNKEQIRDKSTAKKGFVKRVSAQNSREAAIERTSYSRVRGHFLVWINWLVF